MFIGNSARQVEIISLMCLATLDMNEDDTRIQRVGKLSSELH